MRKERFFSLLLCGFVLSCANIDSNLPAQCADEIDNDGDGLVDSADFGCAGQDDDDESDDPPRCGNGVIDREQEECDGEDLGGESCESLGLGGGQLVCAANCVFGTGACSNGVCSDNLDNDQDGFVDLQDPGCSDPNDGNEAIFAESCGQIPVTIFDISFADTSVDFFVPGSTVGFTNQFTPQDTSRDCTQATGGEIVFFYRLFSNANVRFSLNRAATDFDTVLYVRQAACDSPLEACNDDINGAQNRKSELFLSLPAGDYFIFVDGFGGAAGNFELLVDLQ